MQSILQNDIIIPHIYLAYVKKRSRTRNKILTSKHFDLLAKGVCATDCTKTN